MRHRVVEKREEEDRCEILLLARLLSSHKQKHPPKFAEIRRTLSPYFSGALFGSTLDDELKQRITRLEERGWIERGHLRLSAPGREGALALLGLSPRTQNITWAAMKARHLPAMALGLSRQNDARADRLKDASYLRGAIVAKAHALPSGRDVPTISRAVDLLVLRALGVETEEALTLNKVRLIVLRKLLNGGLNLDLEGAKRTLSAHALSAPSGSALDLRTTLLRDWLKVEANADSKDALHAPPAEQRKGPPTLGRGIDLQSFAELVHKAAREDTAPNERFGSDRVYIAAVFDAVVKGSPEAPPIAMTLEDFKARLIEGNREGCIQLARADLAPAMNQELVRRSEIRYLNATFHFLETKTLAPRKEEASS